MQYSGRLTMSFQRFSISFESTFRNVDTTLAMLQRCLSCWFNVCLLYEQEIDRLSTCEKEKELSSMNARNREAIAGRIAGGNRKKGNIRVRNNRW